MISAASQSDGLLLFGKPECGGGVDRDRHIHCDLPILAPPAAGKGAIGRFTGHLHTGKPLNKPGFQQDFPIARSRGLNPGKAFHHPFPDGAEGIVIEAVHAALVEGAVVVHTVPALPDDDGTQLHLPEPAGIVFVQQQFSGQVVIAVFGQCAAEIRCTDEAGGEMFSLLSQIVRQVFLRFSAGVPVCTGQSRESGRRRSGFR